MQRYQIGACHSCAHACPPPIWYLRVQGVLHGKHALGPGADKTRNISALGSDKGATRLVSPFPARQAATGVRRIMLRGIGVGASAALRALHRRCVGCGTKGRPGRSGRPIERQLRWGNRRRRSRRRGAATAIEWRAVRREPQAVVRSTLPEAAAVLSALVRTAVRVAVRSEVRARSAGGPARMRRALRRVVREPVRGEAGTGRRTGRRTGRHTGAPGRARGDARSRRSRPGRARRRPRRAWREAPARGERGGGHTDAVERCAGGGGPARGGERSEPPGKRSTVEPSR